MDTPRTLTTACLTLALLTTSSPSTHTPTTAPREPTTVAVVSAPASATSLLNDLPVRVEDTGAHYRRSDWGRWSTGPGGCDTRETVLRRDALPGTIRAGAGCRILAGRWISPYDGASLTGPAGVQVDHRVPLAEAARSGARNWNRAQRERFANDTANLVAVSARSNTSKGDRDPGRWRPPNRAAWCDYATGYITTKRTYRLTVDPAERAGLAAMLRACGGDAPAGHNQPVMAWSIPHPGRHIVVHDDDPARGAAECERYRRAEPDLRCEVRPTRELPFQLKRPGSRAIALPHHGDRHAH